jgi:hypothetical protein
MGTKELLSRIYNEGKAKKFIEHPEIEYLQMKITKVLNNESEIELSWVLLGYRYPDEVREVCLGILGITEE